MPIVVSMLRGVNLARHRRMKMEDLRALYESMQLKDVRSYVQSGNVIFRTAERDIDRLVTRLEKRIEQTFGFHSDVIVRTIPEMRGVVARNPFATRTDLEPSKLLVTFLARDPGERAREEVRRIKVHPEELHIDGREVYIYFPLGMGRSKLPSAAIDRALGVSGTARNWNSVTRLLGIAEELD